MVQVHDDVVWLKPGQIAERAGVAVSTLHYYESLELIRSRRTAGSPPRPESHPPMGRESTPPPVIRAHAPFRAR